MKVEPGQQLRVRMKRRLGGPRREGIAAQEWRESGARVASGPAAPSSRKPPPPPPGGRGHAFKEGRPPPVPVVAVPGQSAASWSWAWSGQSWI